MGGAVSKKGLRQTSEFSRINSIVELLRWRGAADAEQTAIGFIDDKESLVTTVDFATLDLRARAIGAWLAARGPRGQRVVIALPTGIAYMEVFFGCLYGGAIPVPLFPPHSRSFKAARLSSVLLDCDASHVFAMSTDLGAMSTWIEAIGSRAVVQDALAIDDEFAEQWSDPGVGGKDVAFLQYTSGSTTTPKGVMVSHANLLHNLHMMRRRWQLDENSIIVSWLPIFHDLGVVGNNLLGIFLGAPQYLMAAQTFVKRPGAWLRAIGHYRAHIAMAPNFAYRLCVERVSEEERRCLDLTHWRLAVSCGEPVVPAMVDAFISTFEHCGFAAEAMTPAMGMAETTLFVSGDVPEKPVQARTFSDRGLRKLIAKPVRSTRQRGRRVMSCGLVMDDLEIRIVDPDTLQTLPEGKIGELWVRGDSVALGYWNKPDATKPVFHACTSDTQEEPFLRTGDLAFMFDDELHICGRLKDVIIIRGQNFLPTDIEVALEECHPLLRRDFGVAFAVDTGDEESLVAVYEAETQSSVPIDIAEIARATATAISEGFDLQLRGFVLVRRGTLSKTTSGKVTREKTREQFLKGRLSTLSSWFHPRVEAVVNPAGTVSVEEAAYVSSLPVEMAEVRSLASWLCHAVAQILEVLPADVDPEVPFAAHGLNSLGVGRLAALIEQKLQRKVSERLIYDYPTATALAEYFAGNTEESVTPAATRSSLGADRDAVAIVGIGCRLPGAKNPHEFWRVLEGGVDAVTQIRPERGTPNTCYAPDGSPVRAEWGGFIDNVDEFDPGFFGISGTEAVAMDPQQRLLLEVAWEAMESAGVAVQQLSGSRTGVFVGISGSDYARLPFADDASAGPHDGTGNACSIAANRLSYLWNFRGPSIAVDTACSSSLVAVHMACRSILQGESDLALAAGVNLLLAPDLTITFSQAGMMSPRGRCRSFDDGADGYVRGEGCVALLLKPLSAALRDGDHIRAVIRGSTVNQDGRSNGLTAPNGPAQESVIRDALADARVSPETVDYVESHGSGTPLGDPIEAGALARVFAERASPLLIGSVKTNIGHLEAGAGIAGLLKVVLSLEKGVVPASLHFRKPNHRVPWEQTQLEVCAQTQPWPDRGRARRAGVTSFGFGGTNAHVIVEEAPNVPENTQAVSVTAEQALLLVSAKTETALDELMQRYASNLSDVSTEHLRAFCAAAAHGRTPMNFRAAAVAASPAAMRQRLTELATGRRPNLCAKEQVPAVAPRIAWFFSGQGAAYAGMARELYEAFPVFRQRLDKCIAWSKRKGLGELAAVLLGSDKILLQSAAVAQPALFAFQIALVDLWRAAGVQMEVVCGHSIGEYAAAYAAGMLETEEALDLLSIRGRLMDELVAPGGMLAVEMSAEDLKPHLSEEEGVYIAALNGATQTVCAGDRDALYRFEKRAQEANIRCTLLDVTHAFHSPLMRPVIEPFSAPVRTMPTAVARTRFVSCLEGICYDPETQLPEDYWIRHLESPVDFVAGAQVALAEPVTAVLEIGPIPTLTALAQELLPQAPLRWLQWPGETRSPLAQAQAVAGRLFAAGVDLDWYIIFPDAPCSAENLPTYPFQRRRCWNRKQNSAPLMSEHKTNASTTASGADSSQVMLRLKEIVSSSLGVAADTIDPTAPFLEMGMDSISLIGVIRTIEREFSLQLEVRQIFESLYNLELLCVHCESKAKVGPQTSAKQPAQLPPEPTAEAPAHETSTVSASSSAPLSSQVNALLYDQIRAMTQLMQSQLQLLGAGPQGAALPQTMMESKTAETSRPTEPPPAVTASIPQWKVAETTIEQLTEPQRRHLDALIERYCARTAGSKAYAQRHRPHLADNRVAAGFRALTKEMHYPLVGASAQGARTWDIDGNEYIDVTMGFGVNLLGHNPPFIRRAIADQLERGMQLGPQSEMAGEVAALICELTGNERAAFVNSGTEAIMIACRLARAVTRRDIIVIFSGSYHGQHEATIVVPSSGGDDFRARPGVPGISESSIANTVVLNYGDDASLAYIEANATHIAGVLVEPVQSHQLELQPRAFLHALRKLTKEQGIALIFDEMLTGFRCHLGGAQALFGLRADLVTYGKIIGGGLPIGVISGCGRFMDAVDGGQWRYGDKSYPETETTFVSGTHSKHPLAMAAAYATLQHLKQEGPGLQEHLNASTAAFAKELNAYFNTEGLPLRVSHFCSLFRIAFGGNANLMYYHLLEKGVLLWEGRVYALSTAHTDEDLAHIVGAFKQSVEALREGGFLPPGASAAGAGELSESTKTECVAAPPSTCERSPTQASYTAVGEKKRLPVDFSLSFFGRYEREFDKEKYDLLFASARFADAHDFKAVWIPERHFHAFGGFSPNPSVTAAALARETSRIQLRAGSVVVPLHHPVRIAEEWALVDNLSQGRVGIAAASGWHPDDFVLAPEAYSDNRTITFSNIEVVRKLWRGETVEFTGGTGKPFGARIFPMPKRSDLPIWITVVKNPDTYAEAGRRGFGILTNMMGQSVDELAANIQVYQAARAEAGLDPDTGGVTVLVHAYVTENAEQARVVAAKPFRDYLATMAGLLDSLARNFDKEKSFDSLSQEDRDYLLDVAYRRYVENSALIGSPESCAPIVESLIDAGVTELACFVDFGIDSKRVLESLPHLDRLRERFASPNNYTEVSKKEGVEQPNIDSDRMTVLEEDL
ncbi:type I polyketide synthase [Microbulbifer halophilus]|nr:type I polyketide synthase [Microbulbifer halophilus]MCW8128217.1 aminotransferase class III-fold pyridoxal phosphate-dependent enzyme [Microbulbifer halophilus]